MALAKDERFDEFLASARAAYGDLQNPDYGFFAEALAARPWEHVLSRLRQFLRVEDWTDREDDVSFSCVLKIGKYTPGWLLWLSAVGPFGFLVYSPSEEAIVREDVVSQARPDGPAEEVRILGILADAGIRLLSAEEVESTVDFRPLDGRFPASVFVLLFGDSEVPWWHAW